MHIVIITAINIIYQWRIQDLTLGGGVVHIYAREEFLHLMDSSRP